MKKFILTILSFIMIQNINAIDLPEIESKVKEVTVFFAGAEIVQEAKTRLEKGANSITVTGLSHNLDVSSFRIKANNGVLVSSFEFVKIPVEKDKEISLMQDTLKKYGENIDKIRNNIRIHKNFLDALNNGITNITQNKESSPDKFAQLMDYYNTKMVETENTLYQLHLESTKSQQTLNELNKRINEKKHQKNQGALKLAISAPAVVECTINLTYFTPLASWTPYHDIKVADIDKPVKITTKAAVSQRTGMEWKQVNLKLSTSAPSQKNAPLFNAWMLYNQQRTMDGNLMRSQNSMAYARVNKNAAMEEAAVDMDFQELQANEVVSNRIELSDNTLNLTYDIELPYTVSGDGKAQNIELLTQEAPAEYKHYCAPKLDPSTFLTASIYNWEKLNLLTGGANITFGDTFVGSTHINASTTGETLELTLGVDKRVVVKREKVNEMSSRKIFGSDIKQDFSYRLTVKNNHSRPIKMVLKDQYPISTQKQIEVTLAKETTTPTFNKPEVGVMTWEQEIESGAIKTYTMSYSVKYPKEMTLNL